jgi:hypothetical protein
MLLHELREREQHGTASPPRILAIDSPAASSSTGCEDDEDGGGIPPSSSWARTSSEGIGRTRLAAGFRHLIVVETSLREGLATLRLPTSSSSSPPRSPSRPGSCSAWLSVFLVAYEVVGMRREGDDATDLPNVMYPSPLRWPFFVSVARVSHWPLLAS